MKVLALVLSLAFCNAETLSPQLTGEVLVLSEDVDQLQSAAISVASGSHQFMQLTPPAVDSPASLSCSTCLPLRPHTLSSNDGKLLILTDSHVQVFSVDGSGGERVERTQLLALSADCSPLYLQGLSDGFLVVCATATSFGYQVIRGSSNPFRIDPLIIPDSDITGLVFGSYDPFLQPDTDAFVYIKDGELTFGTLFDGEATQPIFLDSDISCGLNSVTNIYPIPKPVNGQFRFIIDCMHQDQPETLLRYKVTLPLDYPSFPEGSQRLPEALSTGTPISSPDGDYFAVVQETSIAAAKTEEASIYRVHDFQSELRDVLFTDSMVPTLAIVSPGRNHMLLKLDTFISDETSVIELADTPAFCPNQSRCLPHNTAAFTEPNLFFTFTTNTREEPESVRNFQLLMYDITVPSSPLASIENITFQPTFAFPRAISRLFPLTTSVNTYQSTSSPNPTHSVSLLVSASPSIPANYHHTTLVGVYSPSVLAVHPSSSSAAIVSSGYTASEPIASRSRSSSSAIKQTPALNNPSSSSAIEQTPALDNPTKDNTVIPLDFTSTVAIVVILCAVAVALVLVVVGSLLLVTFRRQTRIHAVYSDEEKSIRTPSPAQMSDPMILNPSSTTHGNGSALVTTVGVAETRQSSSSVNSARSSSGQLVTPVTLDLKSHVDSSDNSSGVSSAPSTPSTSTAGDLNTDRD